MAGSYASHIEFSDKRYWDIRDEVTMESFIPKQLKSSSVFREDSNLLKQGKITEAQEAKEMLENIQRKDRKLRANK